MKTLISIFNFLPFTFPSVVLFLALLVYFHSSVRVKSYQKILLYLMIFYLLCSSLINTIFQYKLWHSDAVSKNFLPPVTPIMYFLQYSFTHFWLGYLISIVIAFLFYLILRLLAKRRPWLFLDGEMELGFVCALVAGWPGFVLFLPLIFIVALPLTIFRQFVLKQERTTLGAAFLLAAGVVLIAGGWLVGLLGLGVLRI